MRAKGKNQQPNQPTCIDRIGGRTQAATTCEDASAPTPLSKVLRNSPIPFPPSPPPPPPPWNAGTLERFRRIFKLVRITDRISMLDWLVTQLRG